MLQTIRDRATGWIAWVIVILITIPFAFWGVDSYLQNDSERLVASIDDVEVSLRDYQSSVQQQKQRAASVMGRVDPELFERPEFKRKLLDKMISDQLLSTTVMDQNFRIADVLLAQEIQFSPAFRGENGFDAEKYARVLRSQGESPASFEQRLRHAMAVDQLRLGVITSEMVLPNELNRLIELDRQQREVAWLRLSAESFRNPDQVDDAAIQTYFDANRDAFQTEERVKLAYLDLSVSGLAKQIAVDDAALREYFDTHKDRYVRPEQREAAHIMVAVVPDADEASAEAARQRIIDLRLRLDNGEDFVTLAQSGSEDVSTAADGGALGIVDAGMMGDEFDRVLFSLDEGAVSEPVRTDFGWHLVKAVKIHPAGTKRFEDARDAVVTDYQHQQAEEQFYALGERLADVSYSHSDNLQVAAEETGLSVQTSDFLSREIPKAGLFSNAKLIEAAFSEDVLTRGRNSEVIELAPDHLVVLRIADHEPARAKALDEVKDDVRLRIATEQAAERMQALADTMAETLENQGDVADRDGLTRNAASWYQRGDTKLQAAIANTAFALPKPTDGTRSVDTVTLNDGDIAIVVVSGVKPGDKATVTDEVRKTYSDSLARVGADRALSELVTQLRSERDVKVYDSNL